jgi:hypothetical protein
MSDTMTLILDLCLTVLYFYIINKIFNITYFGFKGIAATLGACFVAALFTEGVVIKHPVWVIVVAIVVIGLLMLIRHAKKNNGRE